MESMRVAHHEAEARRAIEEGQLEAGQYVDQNLIEEADMLLSESNESEVISKNESDD